ncbi:MAG: GNAT family N-acetyltransferase [Nitrospira sp.]|nr:GNAT family N-acetyltransferase [Nitrospira sp.]MCA9499611.1 GNAT family N-acetyltransferase [Nitrospira sp.]
MRLSPLEGRVMYDPIELGEAVVGGLPARKSLDRLILNIQPAERSDMRIAASILRSSAEWYRPFLHEKDMSQHDVDESWGDFEFNRRQFFIGCAEGKPVGVVSTQSAHDMIYIGYLYVFAHEVGKGYGQQLLNHARDQGWEQGKRGLVLIAHPQASWAIRAYQRFGFELIAKEREDVLSWRKGWMEPYYEEGFHLYQYLF